MSDELKNPSYEVVKLIVFEQCRRNSEDEIRRRVRDLEMAKKALADAIMVKCNLDEKITYLKTNITKEELNFVYEPLNISLIQEVTDNHKTIHEII